jgi:hypothetical protein
VKIKKRLNYIIADPEPENTDAIYTFAWPQIGASYLEENCFIKTVMP